MAKRSTSKNNNKEKKKNNNKASSSSSGNAKAKRAATPQPTIYICPYTNQNVYICKATLKDLKAKSTYTNTSKKRLWILTSPQVRNDHYQQSAVAIATIEQGLLPSCGGRSWEVTCKLTEPHWSGQVLFRAWKGEMELAVLPHLIEKIPEPPAWPGKKARPDEYVSDDDNDQNIESLQQREISSLSSVAWDLKDKYPVPSVTLKWQSPQRKIFNSRKAAWEHATQIAAVEVEIAKFLQGIGSSGKLLQPFFPSSKNALKVGKLRFERDGIWVVGQELAWQADRPDELLEEEEEAAQAQSDIASYKSGLDLFLKTRREEYREAQGCQTLKQAETELRKAWKSLSEDEREIWNKQVLKAKAEREGEDFVEPKKKAKPRSVQKKDDDDSTIKKTGKNSKKKKEPEEEPLKLSMTPKAFFVKSRRHEYRKELEEQGRKVTLGEIEIWLREGWKTLAPAEKEEWKTKLIAQETAKAEEEAAKAKVEEEARAAKAKAEEEAQAAKAEAMKAQSAVYEVESARTEPDRACSRNETDDKDKMTKTCGPDKIEANGLVEQPAPVASSITSPANRHTTSPPSNHVLDQLTNGGHSTDNGIVKDESCTENSADMVPSGMQVSIMRDDNVKKETVKSSSSPTTVVTSDFANSLKHKRPITKSRKKPRNSQPPKHALERWCLNEAQMDLCYSACMEHYETVMRTVKARDLHRELEDGFDVLRERGHGRYDMELPAFETESFDFLTSLTRAPWMPVVREILGEDVVLIHKGCFLSMPGAAPQEYHQDGVHLTTQTQRPCHAINVFVPLVDLNARNGPTEFCLGSHILGLEGYDRDFVEIPKPKAGTPVIFDYRLGHRGLGNSSQSCRPIVYCTYARVADGKEFRDSVNFSRKRYHKIGELSSKPASRDERRKNRKRSMDSLEELSMKQALAESAKDSESLKSVESKNSVENDAQDDQATSQAVKKLKVLVKSDVVPKPIEQDKKATVSVQEKSELQAQAIQLSLQSLTSVPSLP